MDTVIDVKGLGKTFTLHSQSGAQIPVFRDLDLTVSRGECLALHGPSGSGKSTLLRCLYANYKPQHGSVCILHQGDYVDIVSAEPRTVLAVRKYSVGYVSQFLRVIPRVPTLDVVARARMDVSGSREEALRQAKELLARLNIPQRLWPLSPVTFSGGEQQRVNIARSFIVDYPILLLDEPTASLDKENRAIVVDLINTAKTRGTAVVGIFHDEEVRASVADRILDFTPMENAA